MKRYIWIADDDQDDRDVFHEIINDLKIRCEITEFKNGFDVVDALDNHVPDILFLDLNMPPLNGYETVENIRSHARFEEIPRIVIFTTSRSEVDQEETFKLGASLFLTKPNEFSDLREAIQYVFSIDWDHRERSKENFLYVKGQK